MFVYIWNNWSIILYNTPKKTLVDSIYCYTHIQIIYVILDRGIY